MCVSRKNLVTGNKTVEHLNNLQAVLSRLLAVEMHLK